jgi:hypothetical protein
VRPQPSNPSCSAAVGFALIIVALWVRSSWRELEAIRTGVRGEWRLRSTHPVHPCCRARRRWRVSAGTRARRGVVGAVCREHPGTAPRRRRPYQGQGFADSIRNCQPRSSPRTCKASFADVAAMSVIDDDSLGISLYAQDFQYSLSVAHISVSRAGAAASVASRSCVGVRITGLRKRLCFSYRRTAQSLRCSGNL